MHSKTQKSSNQKKLYLNILMLIALSFVLINISLPSAQAQRKEPESIKRVLVVKDYKWSSGGMGRAAIMSEITIENRGENDYKDLSVEVDLYTANDIPLGSLRTTIKAILPSKSEQTFYNLNFGIMHSELKNSVARVVNAELIEKGTPTQAKDLILVKNWEWSGGQYGTEGILKEITLDNRSSEAWKDIEINVNFLGTKGGKLGTRGFTSRAVIHDVIAPRSEKTFTGINVGFRHPDAKEVSISVRQAKPISDKELKITTAKKEGKTAVKKKKKKKKTVNEEGEVVYSDSGTDYGPDGKKLSLSEKYKKKLETEQGVTPVPSDSDTVDAGATSDDQVALSDEPSDTKPSVKDVITAPKEDVDAGKTSTAKVDEADSAGDEEEYEYEYDEEVPLPDQDIVVEDFVFSGSVPQTMARISEITLRNLSDIPYTNIQIRIDFFSFKEEAPMFSTRAVISEVLPAKSKKTFKNIKAGFMNAIPQEVRIKVLTAIPFSQY
ncbi:MAG: hypothetical protein E4H21_01295 [Thermodesulfobacteriales bacterium]|nr:MAG: hypothetical protein E4H21_01295 [Thermodesulfobacteriales bacterium]